MIHSAAYANCERIELMLSMAEELYEKTRESEYRRRKNHNVKGFYFDPIAFETMRKEAHVVEMIMAWCVITLESQINHAIAETEEDRKVAIKKIEYPRQFPIRNKRDSELAMKVHILSNGSAESATISALANKISEIRNSIIHDKPFELIERDDEVEISNLRERGNPNEKRYRYEDLADYFRKCQTICDFIEQYYTGDWMGQRVHFKFINT